MYGAILPSYSSHKDKDGKKKQTVIKADDPNSREMVKKFFDEIDD